LRSGLSPFRGEPLSDFRYEGFAREEAARIEEMRWARSRSGSRPSSSSAGIRNGRPSGRTMPFLLSFREDGG
jgi:hypothetical protein